MIEGWVTRDANSLLQPMQPLAFSRSLPQEALPTIEIDDSRTFQPIEGFGFALTGGSAYLLAGLPAADRAELLEELFGLTEASVGLSCLRAEHRRLRSRPEGFHLLGSGPSGTVDPDLARFNLAVCDPEVVPVMQQILRINPAVKIIASPWSAPPWMKTNGSFVGGELKPECYSAYARYFVQYVEVMRGHGIHVSAVTPQNEPHNARNEPSMVMTATDQAKFIKGYLGPELRKGAPGNGNTLLGPQLRRTGISAHGAGGRRGARLYRRCCLAFVQRIAGGDVGSAGALSSAKSVLHRTMGFRT